MPHIHIDFSANVSELVEMGELCEAVREKAAKIDAFPLAGVKVRANKVDHYAIADGNPKHGFIDLSVRIREGRSDTIKKEAIEAIFETVKEFVGPAMAQHSISISAELRDINADLAPKHGTIREHLASTS